MFQIVFRFQFTYQKQLSGVVLDKKISEMFGKILRKKSLPDCPVNFAKFFRTAFFAGDLKLAV